MPPENAANSPLPCCRTPMKSPGPRSSRSFCAISKPSFVAETPVTILKGSKNTEAAARFINYILSPDVQTNVLGFFLLFMLVCVGGVLILTLGGRDLVTSVGATAATLGNIGPGLGLVGPAGNYAGLLPWEKWLLMFLMVAGRLELYTVLVLFMPEAWRRS